MTSRERAISRVRKLRRLAGSPNPAEAARARERADELAAKHGLTEDELAERPKGPPIVNTGIAVAEAWHESLALAIARAYHARPLKSSEGTIAFEGTTAKDATSAYRRAVDKLKGDMSSRWNGMFGRSDLLWPAWQVAFVNETMRAIGADHVPAWCPPLGHQFQAQFDACAREAGAATGRAIREMLK